MSKFVAYALKAYAFLKSPQGKRDVALIVAAIGGALDAYHRIVG
jgi:hypothetical protein